MHFLDHLRTSARASHLANRRLAAALAQLPPAEFHAPRTSFFPSLSATLHHLLAVDTYYLAGLYGEPDMVNQYRACDPCKDVADWQQRQNHCDQRLIGLCDGLAPADLDRIVMLDRASHQDLNPLGRLLGHLLMHQIHHRGQVHAMLSGTEVRPPQLDDFLLPADAGVRQADLAALGWTEADLMADDAQQP